MDLEHRHLCDLKTQAEVNGFVPTLSEIAFARARDLEELKEGMSKWITGSGQQRRLKHFVLSRELNKRYQSYADAAPWPHYQLWMLIKNARPSLDSLRKIHGELPRSCEQVLRHDDREVVWGGLTVLALQMQRPLLWYGASAEEQELRVKYKKRLLTIVEHWHREHLAKETIPLLGAEKECVLIGLMLESGVRKLQYDIGQYSRIPSAVTFSEAVREVESLKKGLARVYGRTWAGWPLDWYSHEGKRRLLPTDRLKVVIYISDVLFRARATLRMAYQNRVCQRWSPEFVRSFRDAADMSAIAWRTVWSVNNLKRLEIEGMARDGKEIPEYKRQEWLIGERNQILRMVRAGQASLDAGDALAAGMIGHELAWRTPAELASSKAAQTAVGAAAYWIRQAGLTVDEDRFPRARRPRDDFFTPEPCGGYASGLEEGDNCGPDAYRDRLAYDQVVNDETAGHWVRVLAHCPLKEHSPRYDPLAHFVYLVRGGSSVPPEDIRSAYALCILYGTTEHAAALLQHWPVGEEAGWQVVRQFMTLVSRSLKALPYGIDAGTHQRWQEVVRANIARLWHRERCSEIADDEWLLVHELLLGRCLTILRNSRYAHEFFVRFHRLESDEGIRQRYSAGKVARQQGPRPVKHEELKQCQIDLCDEDLGTPTLVSVAMIDDRRWNLIVIDPEGQPHRIPLEPPSAPRQEVHDVLAYCPHVRWSDRRAGLRYIASEILRAVALYNGNTKWIILAIEPELATVPWQHLLLKGLGSDKLVSLVPSLQWVVTSSSTRRPCRKGTSVVVADLGVLCGRYENNPEACEALRQMRSCLDLARERLDHLYDSLAIICGHGTYLKGLGGLGFTSIVAEQEPLSVQDWLSLSGYRLVLAPACCGGRTDAQLLGDLAGLPGTVLAGQCRLFCAPIGSVSPRSISTLVTEIAAEGNASIGQRYAAAIKSSPEVAFFNMYGLLSERPRCETPV